MPPTEAIAASVRPWRKGRPTRRALLRAGALGLGGLSLAELFRQQAAQAAAPRTAAPAASGQAADAARAAPPRKPLEACILIFFYGGPSHHDTWDLKPAAPREVRGEFEPIATSVPGLAVCEHLPHTARVADRLAIVHGMHHTMRNHNSAAVEALCGRTPLRGDLELLANDPATDFPSYGAALSRLLPLDPGVPSHVALPHVMYNVVMLPGQTAGFLGAAYEPLQIERDPNAADFRVSELHLPAGLGPSHLDNRRRLLAAIDGQLAGAEASLAAGQLDAHYRRAFDLLGSAAVRDAFDLSREDPLTRDRYGRHTLGQSLLLARRLVEAGVRFVNVNDKVTNGLANWDTHVDNFPRLKNHLLPPADQGFAALVDDLSARGLLDSTLVVWIGEFGRTPRLTSAGGRDHWPDCFSIALAGGGVRGGGVFGASDKLGALPHRDPSTPADLAATLFWRFGLDPAQAIHDGSGRPYRLAEGEPLARLFG